MSEPQISKQDEEQIIRAVAGTLLSEPPTIGVVGVSGTGKSSTINAMFKTDLPISHVVACTKAFRDVNLHVNITTGHAKGEGTVLRVVDAPGLGEDGRRDPEYLDMYLENLSRCDVVLWVMTARNRAVALDQLYLKKLEGFHDRMIFGINQIDIVEPMDWSLRTQLPSKQQERNIQEIVRDRRERLESVVGPGVKIFPYSARYGYGLQELFTLLVESCPQHRAWIFDAIKNFSPFDFLPDAARKIVLDKLQNHPEKGKRRR
jgi:predicted GTPase